jgi:hypothetical protein
VKVGLAELSIRKDAAAGDVEVRDLVGLATAVDHRVLRARAHNRAAEEVLRRGSQQPILPTGLEKSILGAKDAATMPAHWEAPS